MRVYDVQQALDARFREHDEQEVIPAHAGIQEPYRQSQAALEVVNEGGQERVLTYCGVRG